MSPDLQAAIESSISETVDEGFQALDIRTASGGCIHQSYLLHGDTSTYFVKINTSSKLDVFTAEAEGLEAIHKTGQINCPRPILCKAYGEFSFLVMEGLAFGSPPADGWLQMGERLATLHRETSDRFGWPHDNHIGASPQQNSWHDDWAEFFCQQRLQPQFQMARANGYKFDGETELYEAARRILSDHRPEPSLLHGDLWSGNAGFLDDGSPVIYDPACYYGNRETDLAFSEFFGGFPAAFYEAYQKEWPLESGYEQRKTLYNLYHVLNHANLFGGGYASQAKSMIREIVL